MNNSDNTQTRRLHPLVATAAGAVIIASLAATAAVTGLFPKASSSGAQTDQTQAAQVASQPAVVDSSAPANPNTYAQQQQPQAPQAPAQAQAQAQPAPTAPVPSPSQPQYAQQPPAQSAQYAQQPAPQPAYCASCGTVVAISEVRQEGHGTGIGAVGGAVAGGLVGNQFGAGTGRAAMTVLGAVGGGFAGNSVEKHLRSTTAYSVHVRMESGKNRYFTYHEAPPFQQGERVHVENGTLVAG
ncbi:glycine zipper 2TM domain-containing protein [Paraburkholderia phenazinium]|jgi:outer membrane lipoprotein SlyB|uniref:Glycine zipper 2TM domain-containing protein n=1 Tax=Paraburkholderia phenazinium TaxID=60549 RepID=A0A1G7YQI1_9BURK|nr:glycine zipper 2TM domain-containing protein [Paraburkholderia phenazinium]SDG98803.1 Glycine zipper 2TM domain-containing protein [Paraburkholderia phenazinium]